jgi:hypothetical protein
MYLTLKVRYIQYPTENEYSNLIQSNGGDYYAFTNGRHTNNYFDINPSMIVMTYRPVRPYTFAIYSLSAYLCFPLLLLYLILSSQDGDHLGFRTILVLMF